MFIPYLIQFNRFCCRAFKNEKKKEKKRKEGLSFLIYWCLVLCSCILLLFFSVFCVCGRFGHWWVVGVGWGVTLRVDEGHVLGGRGGSGWGRCLNLATSVLTWIICTVCQNGLTHVSMKSSC